MIESQPSHHRGNYVMYSHRSQKKEQPATIYQCKEMQWWIQHQCAGSKFYTQYQLPGLGFIDALLEKQAPYGGQEGLYAAERKTLDERPQDS